MHANLQENIFELLFPQKLCRQAHFKLYLIQLHIINASIGDSL